MQKIKTGEWATYKWPKTAKYKTDMRWLTNLTTNILLKAAHRKT